MSLLPISNRITVIDFENFVKRALNESSVIYVLNMRLQEDDLENMHSKRRACVRALRLNDERAKEVNLELLKE